MGLGSTVWLKHQVGLPALGPCRDSSLALSLAAFVGRNVILTSGCIIGACCNVNTYEVIPENTVIYGADCLRRVQTERPQVGAAWGARLSATSCSLQLPSWQQRGRALTHSPLLSSPKRCSWIS